MALATNNYVTKFSPKVDEKFSQVSKSDRCINKEYDFVGAKTVKVYTVATSAMNDYSRSGLNRYGTPSELQTDLQEMTMTKDRSFTFTIDKMNEDETGGAVVAAKALARQLREVVIPEVDTYRFNAMAVGAGKKVEVAKASPLTKDTIENAILSGTEFLDDKNVPSEGRFIVVTPTTYRLMKESKSIILETEVGQEMKLRGVIAMYDGMEVIKVNSSTLPANSNFLIGHNIACCAPVKLAEYKVHDNVPGISGSLVEGRIYYDAFVLNNKKNALYYSSNATA